MDNLPVRQESWLNDLISDCQEIMTETSFTARWALVEGYHGIGCRILEEKRFQEVHIASLVTALKLSQRQIQRCIQFARKFPDLSYLKEPKTVSWHQIVNKYLPEPSCNHEETEEITIKLKKCLQCGRVEKKKPSG